MFSGVLVKKKLSSLWVVLTMHHWVAQQGMRTGDIVIVIIIFNIVIIISLLLIIYHRRFQRLWMKQYFINTRIKKLPKNTIALLHITKLVMRITDVQFHIKTHKAAKIFSKNLRSSPDSSSPSPRQSPKQS